MLMGLCWTLFARPLIAIQDSEKAHRRAVKALALADRIAPLRLVTSLMHRAPSLKSSHFGIDFPNPVGVAAGMDKAADAVRGWQQLGFGYVEIGGVTMDAQAGNPKPRMFRAAKDRALVNRMGFNNPGSVAMAKRLAHLRQKGRWPDIPVAANLGKSKNTPNEEAAQDYATSLRRLWPYVDLFIINVSSPNTPNLRELQRDHALAEVLEVCFDAQAEMARDNGEVPKPILVKISPDLSDEEILAIVTTARSAGCAGIVATNTSVSRPEPAHPSSRKVFSQQGGLSGAPLRQRSTEVIRLIAKETNGEWPIIGVGGVSGPEDAWEKITNGACLLQIYSALIFEGGGVVKRIVKGLRKKLQENGLSSLDEAVGLALRQ